MNELDQAILEHYATIAGLGGVPLFFSRAPEELDTPYCVLLPSVSTIRPAFGPDYIETFGYTFYLYHRDKAALGALQRSLHNGFDRATLSVATERFVHFVRNLSLVRISDGNLHRTGEIVYMSMSGYNATLDRTFGV